MILPNELILILSLILSFGGVIVFFRLFAKDGIFIWTSIATITANIEVLILIKAFGMEQTLGNVLFAATFVSTDILSECYGKKEASKAVWLGVATNIAFVVLSQIWFLYTPSEKDWVMPSVKLIFSNTPKIMLASLLGYIISERYDVWAYHALWDFTTKKFNDKKKFLWVRNNGSTLSSQLINTVIFNVIAFWGLYTPGQIATVCISGYIIYVCTSLLDTPFIYLARWMHEKYMVRGEILKN
ncbi:MAG: queuosine precursor transporter [Treponema sp.]|nr:queuosine precursor transporter [Treponema sp.]